MAAKWQFSPESWLFWAVSRGAIRPAGVFWEAHCRAVARRAMWQAIDHTLIALAKEFKQLGDAIFHSRRLIAEATATLHVVDRCHARLQ